MPRYEYFTVVVGMVTDDTGEIDRREAFAALREQIMQEMILDDTGVAWGIHVVKDES